MISEVRLRYGYFQIPALSFCLILSVKVLKKHTYNSDSFRKSLITIFTCRLLCHPIYFAGSIGKRCSKKRLICCQVSEGLRGTKETQSSLCIVTATKTNKPKWILCTFLFPRAL